MKSCARCEAGFRRALRDCRDFSAPGTGNGDPVEARRS